MRKRVAIVIDAGFSPATEAVLAGILKAAGHAGWQAVGVANGFESLLHPGEIPGGNMIDLSLQKMENLIPSNCGWCEQANMSSALFRTGNSIEQDTMTEEEISEQVHRVLMQNNIDALIAVTGDRGLSILNKLSGKGIKTVGIQESLADDLTSVQEPACFLSALSLTIDMLSLAYQAARSARKIAVVEVAGEQAGWLALQGATAVCADAVLLPEISCDMKNLAIRLNEKVLQHRPYGLVIVAQGCGDLPSGGLGESGRKRPGTSAEAVAGELQLIITEQIMHMVINPTAHGGNPESVDRQLGIVYGAAAVQALVAGRTGTMVSVVPPEIRLAPLDKSMDHVSQAPQDVEWQKLASLLDIYMGSHEEERKKRTTANLPEATSPLSDGSRID